MISIHQARRGAGVIGFIAGLASLTPNAQAGAPAGDVAAAIDPTHEGAHDFDF